MWKQISNWLHRVTNGWITLIALVIFLGFIALVLPGQAAQTETQTGTSVSPDTSFTYSGIDLYQMAETYGEQGREGYIRARFTFDLIFPIVYTLFLVTAISWLFGKTLETSSPWMLVNLVPLWGALFDYLENISTSLVMWRFPTQTPVVAFLAPIFTLVKWIFVVGSFLILFLGLGRWLCRWGKDKHG